MAFGQNHSDYAGDLSPLDAWALLERERVAQLVDVRTVAEWNFVGVPDLARLERKTHCIEWQSFPAMSQNPSFVSDTKLAVGAPNDAAVLLLCRSGARSRAAAKELAAAGYRRAFNIAGGFEGDLDAARHRGQQNGWKASGLPWKQT